jgi:ABC-type proline/glycine betaine transport system permease subunit
MQLWAAVTASLISIILSVSFMVAYRRDKKKRYFVFAVAAAVLALLTLAYSALTLILIGGID